MAELVREGPNLVVKLSAVEKAEAFHNDIRIPWSAVQSITVLDDAIHAVHGLKLPGSRLPGVFAIGTFKSANGTLFAAVHHHTPRGIKVTLLGEPYDTLIIGTPKPEEVIASLKQLGPG
ncbi:MAG: hypothetical protein C7B44_11515 [Sulfobacillus thermosulfidooxidans]|uniref:hypothetical protein n=1 Tax=Sulfobacillus TaxID=28033 RepID=UPI000CD27D1B|nr:hypothetical protein [Sulfobacillus sp. hq2]POB11666.1 hypothetical protein CO251_03605 [Sulfobacillus sp. hq2]PSR35953.1 MAG: hypothetical protein C7B44_11515 [Sulfobacillus thermosulfidooxidans]